jgi:hypothetical protein
MDRYIRINNSFVLFYWIYAVHASIAATQQKFKMLNIKMSFLDGTGTSGLGRSYFSRRETGERPNP